MMLYSSLCLKGSCCFLPTKQLYGIMTGMLKDISSTKSESPVPQVRIKLPDQTFGSNWMTGLVGDSRLSKRSHSRLLVFWKVQGNWNLERNRPHDRKAQGLQNMRLTFTSAVKNLDLENTLCFVGFTHFCRCVLSFVISPVFPEETQMH